MRPRPTLLLVFSLVFAISGANAAEAPFRVLTENAYATQFQDGVWATIQVTRETFSNGESSTTLFFSAYDAEGTLIATLPFIQIDSKLFVVNVQGTKATLKYPDADAVVRPVMTWRATGDYSEISDLTTKVIDRRQFDFSTSYRLHEKEHRRSADAEGVFEGAAFDIEHPTIGTQNFGSAFLTVRRTTRRTFEP